MKYWWGAAGLLAAVIVAWLLMRGGGAGPQATTAALVEGGGSAAVAHATQRGRRIAGIVERDGSPVPGIAVKLASTSGEEQRTSDAAGRFDFGPRPPRAYVVSAQAPASTGSARAIDLRSADVVADDLRLALYACDVSIHGVVRDVSGGVISEARVAHSLDGTLADLTVITATDGSYELCVPPGSSSLLVSAEGYATFRGTLPAFGHMRRDLELQPQASIHGRVMHEGAAVAGAQVRLRPPMMAMGQQWEQATADADGRFEVSGAVPGSYDVTASADGLATAHALSIVARVGVGADIVLELVPAFNVDGRLVEEGTNKGVAGRGLVLMGEEGSYRDAYTDANGAFVVTGLPAGEYTPSVYNDDHKQAVIEVVADVHGITLAIKPRIAIGGKVLRDGRPVEGAIVSSHGESTEADREGRYVLHLPNGTQRIYAESARVGAFANKELEVGQPRSDVDIELALAGTIAGTLVDQSGAPVAGALIECTKRTDRDYGAGLTGEDGAFTARSMSGTGVYDCQASRSDREQRYPLVDGKESVEVLLDDGKSAVTGVRLAVRLDHLRLAGHVVDASGAPVSDVMVIAMSPSGMATTFSDATGAFGFRELAKETLRVQAQGPHGTASLDGVAAGRTDLVIKLPAIGSVDGTLLGFTRRPRVMLMRQDESEIREVTMTATGFHADALAAGEYRVIATGRDASATGDVVVITGQTATITLTGQPVGRIEGTVRDATTHAPISISCMARSDDHVANGQSDADGALSIGRAFAGSNVVTCGRDRTPHPIDVVAGQTSHLELEVAVLPEIKVHLGFALEDREQQVFVSAVEPDGIAARAGLAVGDRLVRYMGMKIKSPSKGDVEAFEEVVAEQPLQLGIERAGKTFTITLSP